MTKIAVYAGAYGYWGELNPSRLIDPKGGQLGGGETAVLTISAGLASLGYEVILCGSVTYPLRVADNFTIVDEGIFTEVLYGLGTDVLVSWDAAAMYRMAMRSKLNILAYQLNDTEVGVMDYNIDAYFHPSRWHADRFHEVYGVPLNKQVPYMTNGTTLEYFERVKYPKRGKEVVYCSSPDRGLHHLLRVWPAVQTAVPDASLHIYYDMTKWLQTTAEFMKEGFKLVTTDRALDIKRMLPLLQSKHNVTYHGGVSKALLSDAMLRASVLAYPCDPVAPTEGFSMTILDGWTAGLHVVTTDADALPELWGKYEGIRTLPLPVDQDLWESTLIDLLSQDAPEPGPNKGVPREFLWDSVIQKWDDFIKERLYAR